MQLVTILLLLFFSAGLFAFLMVWQVKTVPSDIFSVLKYNFTIIPLVFLANSALGLAFIKGHDIIENLPLINVVQTFIYYLLLMLFSVWLLGDRVSTGRGLVAFVLIGVAIWLLRK